MHRRRTKGMLGANRDAQQRRNTSPECVQNALCCIQSGWVGEDDEQVWCLHQSPDCNDWGWVTRKRWRHMLRNEVVRLQGPVRLCLLPSLPQVTGHSMQGASGGWAVYDARNWSCFKTKGPLISLQLCNLNSCLLWKRCLHGFRSKKMGRTFTWWFLSNLYIILWI